MAEEGHSADAASAQAEWVARRAGHVAKAVKGLLVALVMALSLELTSDAGAAALALLGTVLAILFSNLYGDYLQREVEAGRRLLLADLRSLAGHLIGIPLGIVPAFVLFVLAWLGIISTAWAVDAAIWSGIGLLFALGFLSGRIQGNDRVHAVGHGLVLAVIGIAILALKTLH
jgi:hypothetical protein